MPRIRTTRSSVREVFAGASAPGATTNCFHSRSECARANSRDSASRLPRRLTATKNASSPARPASVRSEEHTSELQSHSDLVCRLLLEKKKKKKKKQNTVLR